MTDRLRPERFESARGIGPTTTIHLLVQHQPLVALGAVSIADRAHGTIATRARPPDVAARVPRQYLGNAGAAIIGRVMGLVLAALAIETITAAVLHLPGR